MHGSLTAILIAAPPAQIDTTALPKPLVSAMTWWFLMIITKAVGQRVKPHRVGQKLWDTILDILTLVFALQVALSIGQTKLVSTIVKNLKGGVEAFAGGTGYAVTGVLIGGLFAVLAFTNGRRFAKEDELSSAWRPLSLFALFALVALTYFPVANGWIDVLARYVSLPIGNGVLRMIGYILESPH